MNTLATILNAKLKATIIAISSHDGHFIIEFKKNPGVLHVFARIFGPLCKYISIDYMPYEMLTGKNSIAEEERFLKGNKLKPTPIKFRDINELTDERYEFIGEIKKLKNSRYEVVRQNFRIQIIYGASKVFFIADLDSDIEKQIRSVLTKQCVFVKPKKLKTIKIMAKKASKK